MSEIVLDKIDPERKVQRKAKREDKKLDKEKKEKTHSSGNVGTQQNEKTKNSRYVPADLKQKVLQRDGYACTYKDPKTGNQVSRSS